MNLLARFVFIWLFAHSSGEEKSIGDIIDAVENLLDIELPINDDAVENIDNLIDSGLDVIGDVISEFTDGYVSSFNNFSRFSLSVPSSCRQSRV